MTKPQCHYCGKGFPMFGAKRLPAHPKDVGFDENALSCEECWRTRVAGVGLTQATGDSRTDGARIREYKQNAEKLKESGDALGALENYEKFVELSLKCLGYKRGAEFPRVNGGDLHSMGDLYAAAGNTEKSRESYQLAIKLLEDAATPCPLSPLAAVAWGVTDGLRKGTIDEIKGKLSKLPPPPPPP